MFLSPAKHFIDAEISIKIKSLFPEIKIHHHDLTGVYSALEKGN